MLWITLVLFIVGEAVAQRGFSQPCPPFGTVQDFNVNSYKGTWYEFAKYATPLEIVSKCTTAIYFPLKNGKFAILNIMTSTSGGKPYITSNRATPVRGNPRKGKFKLVFTDAPYWILATDYENWALVGNCITFVNTSTRNFWIYTRARNPSGQVIRVVYKTAEAYNLQKSDFVETDQKNCS